MIIIIDLQLTDLPQSFRLNIFYMFRDFVLSLCETFNSSGQQRACHGFGESLHTFLVTQLTNGLSVKTHSSGYVKTQYKRCGAEGVLILQNTIFGVYAHTGCISLNLGRYSKLKDAMKGRDKFPWLEHESYDGMQEPGCKTTYRTVTSLPKYVIKSCWFSHKTAKKKCHTETICYKVRGHRLLLCLQLQEIKVLVTIFSLLVINMKQRKLLLHESKYTSKTALHEGNGV